MGKIELGIQLYSVREQMKQNLQSTLEQIAKLGYRYVEFAGLYGKTGREMGNILKNLGLIGISAHQNFAELLNDNGQRIIDDFNEIGVKFAAQPWLAADCLPGGENYQRTVDMVQAAAELLRKNNIEPLYHNHDFEFEKLGDRYKLDIMLDDFKIGAQPDVCWIKYAGLEPTEFLKKYSGKCPVVHLKDFTGNKEQGNFKFKPLGHGVQNMEKVIASALENGARYFIAELDSSDDMPPLDAFKLSIDYVNNLNF